MPARLVELTDRYSRLPWLLVIFSGELLSPEYTTALDEALVARLGTCAAAWLPAIPAMLASTAATAHVVIPARLPRPILTSRG
jgi:hypothetical protein